MASTISFSGLSASGLDTSSWVDALVSVKQQTVTSLEAQKAEKENLLSIVNNIKSYFSSFQSCLQKLTDSQYGIASMDLFMQNLALSSNANIATASATTEAARQSYDVAVDSLATATKATSGYSQFEVKTADLNTTFGTLGGKNGTITVNSQSFTVTTEDTLGSLVDKFKNVGVDASFDEKKGTFTVGIDLDKIDEGATNLKNALKLKNNNVSGAVSGSIVYANRSTEFSKLGLTAGKIMIEGVEHTIAKNGDNYTIQKAGGSAVSMNTLGEFFDYLKSSAVGAEDASVDGKGNITIKGATLDKVEGGSNLMEVLNLIESQKRTVSESGALSYVEVRNADLNTKLSALGVTGDTTLVAGGKSNTITNDKTLGDIQKILKNAGVEMSVDNRGVITIDTKGNEISGTLLDVLNLDPTKGGTTITSSAHQANLKADLNTKLSDLGVKDSDKYVAYKSDGTAVTVEMTNLSGKSINTLITDLKNVGLDATFDEKTHQIIIKDGYITGSLADVLGMTQSTTSYTESATLSTKLSALGATGDSTLTINGGSAKTYGKDTTLQTVFDDIKNAGGKVTFKDGNVTIEGVTLGGSIPALLGLDATTQGTSVTSGKLTAVTGSSSTGGGNDATVEHDIDLNTKIGDITGNSSSYTLKVDDGTSKTYTKDTTLQELKNQIESAGGTFTINDDNTISIEGVTMSGTLVGVLGFDELETGTRFTTVNAVMISGTSNVASGGSTLGDLGLVDGASTHSAMRAMGIATFATGGLTLSINGGIAKTYGSGVSLDDIFADIVAAGGTASIDDEGYINIKGVHLEGTLVDKLGLVATDYKTTITSGNLKVTTSTSSTSSSILYSEQKGDISWNSTVGSIVGDRESYNLVVNGINNTIGTNTKLSDIRTIIQNAGGTMTVNDDNTISVNGVELSGSLVDKLGFMSNGVHTVISSNDPIYYTDGTKFADSGSTFEQLGISADKRDFAIYKNDGTLVKASSTTGSASGKTIGDWLKVINDALNSANGTTGSVYATINNGVISISGGYVTGSLPTELGIGTTQVVTGITMEGNSVTYTEYDPLKYIGNVQTGSGTAAGNVTSTGMIGAVVEYTDEAGNVLQADENTKLADILDTSGNKLGSGSFTFNVGNYTKTFDADSTTLGDIRDYVNNLNTDTTYDTNTSASIADGKIAIESNVDITGTLMSALGFEKSDISTIAYEIKGTGKAHYSKSEGVTVKASGFTTSITAPTSTYADKIYVSELSDFTSGSTYYVKSASDLNKLAELTNAGKSTSGVKFVLENDIDLAGQQFVPIGTYNNTFQGSFYGNGHVIKNLTITDTSVLSDPFIMLTGTSQYQAGLFGCIQSAELYDIGLENVNIDLQIDGGDFVNVGALVGNAYSSKINNCYSTGSVSSDYFTGGLVGYNGSYVLNSYSTANVANGLASGGLVGSTLGGKISNSFATGNVNGSFEVGGLVGELNSGSILNSFATGDITGKTNVGGLFGDATSGNITISDSYATGNVFEINGNQKGIGNISSSGTVTATNCGYSSSTGLGSGVSSGATAMTDAQLKSAIEGLGISSATVVNKTVDTTADLTTKISDLMGKSGSQTLTLTPTAGGSAVTLTFNDTDTIQTVIDKLKAQGIDEADLTDGVFRIRDDKQWTISGALANKLFGGDDDVYTYTGNKVTYTTTGAGTAGSITSDKITYTVSTGAGSKTGNKLTYTESTTSGTFIKDPTITPASVTFVRDGLYWNSDTSTYQIYSAQGLVELAKEMESNYADWNGAEIELACDIDMSGVSFDGISNFSGIFNGNGHTISNLKTSLFNSINYSDYTTEIKNLVLKDVNITKTNTSSGVGALVATTDGDLTIDNVYATGNITVANTMQELNVGGLIGSITSNHSTNISITNSYVDIAMNLTGSTNSNIGGVVGSMTGYSGSQFEIDNVYSAGNIILNYGGAENGSSVCIGSHLGFGGDSRVTYNIRHLYSSGTTDIDAGDKYTSDITVASKELGQVTKGSRTEQLENAKATISVLNSSSKSKQIADVDTLESGMTYHIKTAQDLVKSAELYNNSSATGITFVLDNDIDMSGITDFLGFNDLLGDDTFNGNNHVIKNLTMSETTGGDTYFGFFNQVIGTVMNLGLENVNIFTDASSVAGSLAGAIVNGGSILNCSVSGFVTGVDAAGGLVGEMLHGGTLKDCTALVTVNASETDNIIYSVDTVGTNEVENCIAYDVIFAISDLLKYDDTGALVDILDNWSSKVKKISINTADELKMLADYVSSGVTTENITFVLGADIDMSGVTFNGLGNFQGKFYGNGHTISGLTSSLFGSLSDNAVIKDVGLINSNVDAYIGLESGGSTYGSYGLLATKMSGNAKIENCYANGTLTSSSSGYIGGLVGSITDNASILYSHADVTITGTGNGQIIGGLVGKASENAVIDHSYSSGSITSSETGNIIGGFVGQLLGDVEISNAYTTMAVSTADSADYLGAFVGQIGYISGGHEEWFDGSLTNVFATADEAFTGYILGGTYTNVVYNSLYPDSICGTNDEVTNFLDCATGLTLAQMQDGSTLKNYGFTEANGWYLSSGSTPSLSSSGSTTTTTNVTATGSTTLSQLGVTDFKINGTALTGISASSTIDEVLTAIKNQFGVKGSISDGKVTLDSDTEQTLSGGIINKFFGSDSITLGGGSGSTTTKTYTGSQVTIDSTSSIGYTADTKLSAILSDFVGQRIYVKSSSYTGSTTGYPYQSIDFTYLDITDSTTIQDVVNFFNRAGGVSSASYDQLSGELSVTVNDGYSVNTPFRMSISDMFDDTSKTIKYCIGTQSSSLGTNMNSLTTLDDLLLTGSRTLTVTNNGTTTSFDVTGSTRLNDIINNLESAGCTTSLSSGVLTVTGGEDLAFGGDTAVWNKIFGGSIPTPTTSSTGGGTSGSTTTVTATGSTTLGQLGLNVTNISFLVDGNTLYLQKDTSGGLNIMLSNNTTLDQLFSALQDQFGITGSITDGKITLSSDTAHTLTGSVVERLFGLASVEILPTSGGSTTHTATEDTTLGDLGLTSFDLKINGTSISGLSASSKISDVFAKLADNNITATMTDGKITLTSNSAVTLSGTVAEKLLGSSSVTLAGDSTEHTFDMEQISASKSLYTSRSLTYNSGAQKVSDVTELVAGNKYHIASADDLVKLSEFVNSGADTTGSIFIFDNDIDMSSVTNFTSIGTLTNAFKGTIYGNGHVVKNLKIDSTNDYQGLFGYVQQATIQDLGVVDANVKGGEYTGILIGNATNTIIKNAYSTGTIKGDNSSGSQIGGLIGQMLDSTGSNLYSTATVNGVNNVGGVVGCLNGSTLETSYATGDITSTGSISGGLVGGMCNGGSIKNAFATGNVNGNKYVGGLLGFIQQDSSSYTLDTVYATGNVTGNTNVGGLLGYRKSDSATITNAIYNKNAVSAGVGSGSSDGITGKNFEQMLMKSVMESAGFTEDKGWVYKDGATPTFGNMTVSGGGGKVYLDDTITSFTSGSAYYISSLEQLNKLASLVNSGASTAGVSFILENDLDVSAFTTAIGSTSANAFKGTFYGNGHTLTGLKTNLFNYVDGEAVIRDLGLENMTGSGHLASSVAGNSTIDNVYSTGSTTVSGLVNKLGGSATIKSSYSTATVNSSSASAGGLVAQMEGSATIEKSFATGNVKASTSAGALVGSMSGGTVKSSYATGNVTGGSYRGGLIGQVTGSVTIQNSYASGTATGGFIGRNSGSVTSTGNVYNSANSKAVGSGSSISGLTALSLADMKSQAKMEALGFTASNGWYYYAGKTPMLQGQDTSSSHTANVSLDTKIDSILNSGEGRNVKVTANGTTYEKYFEGTDTVKDVRDWLNTISGVTATFDETNSTFKVSGSSEDFRIDGDLANALFGGRKTTTKTSSTVNTDSNELLVDGNQAKITNNTTVGQLLGKTSGEYAIGFYDDNGNLVTKSFGVDAKLSEVLQYLKDNGFEASITNGVFTASKDGRTSTDILGTIGNKLKGETGTVTTTDSGYQTGALGSSSSTKATASTKLSELGIDSGSILIKDNNNNNLGTIQINNSMTIDDAAQLLANYGFTLTITDGKVKIVGEGTNRLADGTSNMVSQMKLDNWTETKDKLKTSSTVAQMGFGKGSTLSLILDNKTYNLKFDATDTLQDIIDTLGTYGVTASVDANGKFTASANGNMILSNELGAYLTQNSAEGYVKEANGYKSKDPLEFRGDKVKLDYDSTIGDILGTGKDGVLRLTIDNTTVVDLRYRADETMADIIADLKGYGITATINDGVLTAVSDGHTFRFSGEIGKIISGDTPLYEDVSTGYKSKDLSYTTTGKATLDNTLKEMGISSGQIHILSNDGKIVSTLDIDNSYTVAQIKSLLQPYGMDLSIDADGKVTVTSSEGYKLSDGTSNMVSTMKLNNWTTTTEKLTGATTLSQMGFKDGADLNLFLDGAVMNVLSFDADQTLDDIIFALSAYGIDASVNADGQFTATSKTHTFIMSGGLGSYLTKGTGGYVNSDTAYKSYKPLTEEHPYITDTSSELGYKKLMTESSTLESLGFAQGGSVRIMLDGTTPYSLEFLATDTVQDVIYALSAYGINAEVKDGKFVAESVNNTFTITGNFGSYLVQGGVYKNEVTGYESAPLTYNTTEKLTNDTKLSSLGVTRGAINVIKDGKVADTINITNDTTIGQLFSAIKPYGMTGSIVTDASGNTSIRISADSDIKLADGTSNVVSALGLHDVRQGDFEGHKEYWDDDATSGLITEDMLLSSLDRNGFIAQGSLIFTTGEGDDAVQHIINITADETVGSLLKKFNDSGIKAELDNGIIKLTGGLDKLTFNGGTSGLVKTIGLDIHNIDKYASSSSALTYEGETHYSASNFANANTTLDIVNATDGIMSVFVDGIKCNVEVKSSDTFAELFKKIKDTVKAKSGFDIEAGFLTKDGSISTNPTDANNTGIIALSVAEGHELVVGASNDTTNFATIANLNKTGYNTITGSRALYRVNVNSLITQSGLYRDGDITEGTFTIGDAEFTIDSTTTLSSLINQINKNDKAYANAYWDTLSGTLVIQSTNTGASLINIEAGTSNFTDIMGFTKQKDGVSALVTDSQTLGQNAVIRINGTTVTSATNVITSDISRIKGLTINLKNVSEGETVTITVEQDKESIYNAVSDTLDSYNAMMEALNKELSDRSSLGGESILKLMRNSLKRLMTSSLTGAYVYKNLASIGISTGEASDNITTNVTSLLIDKDKFMDALATDSDAVQDLLVGTKANPGIFLQANNIVESSIKTDGYFSNMANTLTKSISNINKKITKVNTDIENYRTKLQSKFHNMELTISGLQSAYANLLG